MSDEARDDDTVDDPLPALQAQLDQAASMAPMLAGVVRAYFAAFVAEGFSESQACYLALGHVLQDPGSAP